MKPPAYRRALATVVRRSALPYGYTLTIWASGAVLEHAHGTPDVAEIFLFMLGAVAGFILVGIASRTERNPPVEPQRGDLVRTGFIQAAAVGLALGAAALLATVDGLAAWALASLGATAVYLSAAGAELALSSVACRQPLGGPPSAGAD